MTERAESVLYVRLPCWKIYPGGVIYVADYIHKQRPKIDQHILDLALIAPRRRKAAEHALRGGNKVARIRRCGKSTISARSATR